MFKKTKTASSFLKWIIDEGALQIEDNVFFAERVFFAHGLATWCIVQSKAGKIDQEQVDRFARLIRRFIKKELDLYWRNGIINMRYNSSKEENNEGHSLET
tara:strand:+ start:584 stop:886 length:303 start_codon:yes stop_codon:yes gene_type:complete